ncbi:tolloid-like protein 1 [Lithobates pipiens]
MTTFVNGILCLFHQNLQQRKKREINETRGLIMSGEYVVGDLDIAYSKQRSTNDCPKNICLWTKSIDGSVYIPYVISRDYSVAESQVIQSALDEIESLTCIRYIKQTSETDYLSYRPQSGCWSMVGQIGGAQAISLDTSGCIMKGIAIHESLHALGLDHEHVRKDRDNYVVVLMDNIIEGYTYAFAEIDTLNVGLTKYDYGSIMHYARYAFTKNGLPTLKAIPDDSVSFGQRFAMSDLDIIKINTLYNCSSGSKASNGQTSTTTPTTTTTTAPALFIPNTCKGILTLTAPQGIITSPNFPNNYPKNAFCQWTISTTSKIKITFTDFDVDGDMKTDCTDELYIYDSQYMFAAYGRFYCGQTLPASFISRGNIMQIIFTSDSTISRRGFRLVYGPGPILFGEYVVGNLDIAYSNKRIGSGCPKDICLWGKSSDGNVYIPYVISSDYSDSQSQVIQSAMKDIESLTCIRYIKQTSEVDYLRYQPRDGCWSMVGRIGGQQTISLDISGCISKGIAIHESLHALGLHHEHMRNDRDGYVNVLWNNIQDGLAYAFNKTDTFNVDLTKYDYGSIMHYSKYSFTKNGMPTLEAIPNRSVSFGQRIAMSSLDVTKINTLYSCSNSNGQTNTMTTPATVLSNACNGTLKLTAPQGVITSPNFPNNYTNNAFCYWNITTTNSQLKITFTDFDVDGDMNKGCADNLLIYKGKYAFAAYMNLFCGQTLPPSITFQENAMQIIFTSNSAVSRKGFRLVYGPGSCSYHPQTQSKHLNQVMAVHQGASG